MSAQYRKKFLMILSAVITAISFTACQKSENDSQISNSSEDSIISKNIKSEEITEKSEVKDMNKEDALIDEISTGESCWIGAGNGEITALAFSGERAVLSTLSADNEKSDIEGYWEIENGEFYIYSDKEKTEELCLYAIKAPADTAQLFIKLHDTVLVKSEKYGFSDTSKAVSEYSDTEKFMEKISDGTVWSYSDDDCAYMFTGNETSATLYGKKSDGNFVSVNGYMAADDKYIYFFDENDSMQEKYEWSYSEEKIIFSAETGNKIQFTKSENQDADEVISDISEKFNQ